MNHDSSLKFYLSHLNDAPLLTREEEIELLKNIETYQNEILRECISSDFFKGELLDLLTSKDSEDVVKISRKLDENSSKKDVKEVTKIFKSLISSLKANDDKPKIRREMKQLALSGTLVNSLVQRIKKKYTRINDYEEELVKLVNYFEVRDEGGLQAVVEKIQNDELAKKFYARKFYTTEQRLLNRVHDYIEHVQSKKSMADIGITEDNFKEIKKLYKSIVDNESKMQGYKDELVRRNLRLVVSRAKKFNNRGLEFEDLVQEGNIGLIKAINKHDSSRGTKISTYATWWIDQTIRRAISNKAKTVRIPTHIEFLQTQLSAIVTALTNELGRQPTKEEIAERADISADALEKLDQVAMYKVAIDEEMPGGGTMLDILPADPSNNPFNIASRKILRDKIRQILGTLPPRTEKIIRLRFGIGEPREEMTLQQIADTVGLTKMGVRLVQNKGLEKMKKKGDLDEL